MRVVVVEPPEPFVTLEKAKSHLRVDGDDDDALIVGYIASAIGVIDGPTGWLGRAIGRQTLEAVGQPSAWGRLELSYPPIVDILSVDRVRWDIQEPIDPAGYSLSDRTVSFSSASSLSGSTVKVRYRAGYEVVPPAIVTGVLLMVGALYANREGTPNFAAADALLQPYRLYR